MIARLACTLLIVCLSSLYGLSKGHSDIISLDILLEKEPLTDVLKKLESDFDIHFLFKSNLIESVEVEYEIWNVDDEIHDILEDLLDGTDILFKKINKNSYIIVPSKKERILKGHIYGRYDRPLIGATIQSTTNSKGAITNLNGYYELALPSGNHQVEVRHVGYKSETESVDIHPLSDVVIDHHLTESGTLEEIVVLGSKLKPLSVIGSARPIQRVSKTEIERSGFISLTESLNGQVPSFHSTFQTISDGTDHITPSSLRGLGPDQLLVLVNGKRRHHSSLLNINGTTGRGSVSTDLNAIPLIAIEDIEVLSEDAVALYGSDAIGGVINIKLKENQNYSEIRALSGITQKGDGQNYQLGGIVGIELGSKGQLNVSMDFRKNEPINRAGRYTGPIFGDDRDEDEQEVQNFYNQTGLPYGKVMEIGAGGSDNAGLFLNLEYPIKDNLEFYLSSGVNYRLGKSRGFYRFPYQERRQSGLFPYGFSPILKTRIWDQSSIIGLRRQQNGWNIDLSNTYGSNTIGFHVANSNNASLGLKSPIEGHVGGFKYFQNVTNFDAKSNRKNMDFGFGFEFKMEGFEEKSGEPSTYIDGGELTQDGIPKEIGMQVFPGFDPSNELFATRISLGTYLAAEKEVIDKIQLDIATRMEYYENYGASIIWNTGMKYQHNDKINIRLSANSGYRAPSMPQVHHQSESFQFRSVQGELIPERVQHIKDGSALAKLAHLDPLKPETSLSYNLGFDYSPNSSFSLEVDAYQVKIANRIVLSGVIPLSSTDQLYETFSSNDITSIQFLSNAIGTSTRGISFSSKYKYDLDRNKFVFQINGNLNKTRLNRTEEGAPVFSSSPLFQGLEHIVFDREEVARTENSSPDLKLLSSVNWVRPSYSLKLSGAYYGSVSYLHSKDGNPENWVTNARNGILESRDQRFAPKAVFDLSFDYALSDVTNVTVGVNNLFDTYPDEHTHSANVSYGNFKYSRRVSQFGVRGRYFFTSLSAKF